MTGCASVWLKSSRPRLNRLPKAKLALTCIATAARYLSKDFDGNCVGVSAPDVFLRRSTAADAHRGTESEFFPTSLNSFLGAGKITSFRRFIKVGLMVGGADLEQVTEAADKLQWRTMPPASQVTPCCCDDGASQMNKGLCVCCQLFVTCSMARSRTARKPTHCPVNARPTVLPASNSRSGGASAERRAQSHVVVSVNRAFWRQPLSPSPMWSIELSTARASGLPRGRPYAVGHWVVTGASTTCLRQAIGIGGGVAADHADHAHGWPSASFGDGAHCARALADGHVQSTMSSWGNGARPTSRWPRRATGRMEAGAPCGRCAARPGSGVPLARLPKVRRRADEVTPSARGGVLPHRVLAQRWCKPRRGALAVLVTPLAVGVCLLHQLPQQR